MCQDGSWIRVWASRLSRALKLRDGTEGAGEGGDTSRFRQGGGLEERYQADDTAVVSLLTLEARRGIQGVTISRRKEAPKGTKVACTDDTRVPVSPVEPKTMLGWCLFAIAPGHSGDVA
jgi:hypothetical protein